MQKIFIKPSFNSKLSRFLIAYAFVAGFSLVSLVLLWSWQKVGLQSTLDSIVAGKVEGWFFLMFLLQCALLTLVLPSVALGYFYLQKKRFSKALDVVKYSSRKCGMSREVLFSQSERILDAMREQTRYMAQIKQGSDALRSDHSGISRMLQQLERNAMGMDNEMKMLREQLHNLQENFSALLQSTSTETSLERDTSWMANLNEISHADTLQQFIKNIRPPKAQLNKELVYQCQTQLADLDDRLDSLRNELNFKFKQGVQDVGKIIKEERFGRHNRIDELNRSLGGINALIKSSSTNLANICKQGMNIENVVNGLAVLLASPQSLPDKN